MPLLILPERRRRRDPDLDRPTNSRVRRRHARAARERARPGAASHTARVLGHRGWSRVLRRRRREVHGRSQGSRRWLRRAKPWSTPRAAAMKRSRTCRSRPSPRSTVRPPRRGLNLALAAISASSGSGQLRPDLCAHRASCRLGEAPITCRASSALSRAIELCWLGDMIVAEEALRIGMGKPRRAARPLAEEVGKRLTARLAAAPPDQRAAVNQALSGSFHRTLEQSLGSRMRRSARAGIRPIDRGDPGVRREAEAGVRRGSGSGGDRALRVSSSHGLARLRDEPGSLTPCPAALIRRSARRRSSGRAP